MVSPRNLRPFIDGTIPAPQQAQRLLMPARQDSTAVFLAKEGDSARVYYPVDSTNEVVAPAQPGIYPKPGTGGIVPVLLGSDGRISQVLPPLSVDLGAAVPVGEAGEKLYGAATATYVDDQLAPARDAIAELTDPETGVVARVDQAQADADAAAGVAASLRALIDAGLMRAAKKSSPPAVEKGLVWAVLDDETGEKLVGLRVPNSDASEWVPYQLLVEDLMVVGEGGTIRFKDGVITAPNLNVTEEMVARFGYFAQAFFDEAIARNIKVTNELIAEEIIGKTLTSGEVRTHTAANQGIKIDATNGLRAYQGGQLGVQISPNMKNAMAVRAPTGTMIPLSDAAFGTQMEARTDVFYYMMYAPRMEPTFTAFSADDLVLTFTAWGTKALVSWSQHWGLNMPPGTFFGPVIFNRLTVNTKPLVAGNGGYVTAMKDMRQQYTDHGMLRNAEIGASTTIDLTPGETYTLRLEFAYLAQKVGSGANPEVNSSLSNRFISVQQVP